MLRDGIFIDCGHWCLKGLKEEGAVLHFSLSLEVPFDESRFVGDDLREELQEVLLRWGRGHWSKKRKQAKERKWKVGR